jgi:hypothetical protein
VSEGCRDCSDAYLWRASGGGLWWRVTVANSNWATDCANQTAGRTGQKGGKRTATLYTAALRVSVVSSAML